MTEDLYANMEVAPGEVKDMLARGEKLLFVDVREKWEYDTTHIEGSVARLEAASELVLFCHHGMRSLDAAAWLRSQGVEGARSMSGGIDRWSAEIDPNVPRY